MATRKPTPAQLRILKSALRGPLYKCQRISELRNGDTRYTFCWKDADSSEPNFTSVLRCETSGWLKFDGVMLDKLTLTPEGRTFLKP